MYSLKEKPEETILKEIHALVSKKSEELKSKTGVISYYEAPLVGFADGNDPLFLEFKNIIGDFHLTPLEILERSFPEYKASREGSSVISWVLPISQYIRESNRKENRCCSKIWAEAKIYGQELTVEIQEHIASFINEQGFLAVPPTLGPFFEVLQLEDGGFAANWSEKHAAYTAGLGTFALSGGLITERGIAMRIGSVVTSLKLNPTKRSYRNYREYCLFYSSGTCGSCIERCPGGAISDNGHDKDLCMEHCAVIMQEIEGYDAGIPSCGICQTAVPCEAGIPEKIE